MRGQVDQICLDYGGVKGLAGLIVIGQEMQQLRDRLAPTPEGKVACSSLAAEAERMSRTTLEQRMNVYGADLPGWTPAARRFDDGNDCPQPEPG